MGQTFLQFVKNIWGSDQSRGFRLTAWGIALIGFMSYTYYDSKREIDIYKWNEKIKAKEILQKQKEKEKEKEKEG